MLSPEEEKRMAGKKRRGFASMDLEHRRAIASLGGQAAHEQGKAHEFTSEEARRAGEIGGWVVSRDRRYMARLGRMGGTATALKRKAEKGKEMK
jgi:uncharacterized protein